MRPAWGVVVGGLAAGAVARVMLLDWAGSVAVGLLVVAVSLAVERADRDGEPWRWQPERTVRTSERHEAQALTWALAGHDGRVSRRALQQLQAVGAHRLARHGLDLASSDDDAALRALVGARALATLRRAREPWPRLNDVVHTITALDRLGPGHPARSTIPSRSNPR